MQKLFIYRIGITLMLSGIVLGSVMYFSLALFSFATIAMVLGLRHGLDADHIVAIDNITRKLATAHKPSATTGLYFALGHSTIVFILTLMVVLGLNTSHAFYSALSNMGDQLGNIISIIFLFLTLALNIFAIKNLKLQRNNDSYPGLIFTLANKYLFNVINRPEKMFVVGFFFGLGFDTATEVALLAMAATSVIHGYNIVFILLLPILFACGMSFTDTVNSIFMSRIYTWVGQSQKKLYLYNYLILSFATLATLVVTIVEFIDILSKHQTLTGSGLFRVSNVLNNNFDVLGASIIGVFILLVVSLNFNLLKTIATRSFNKNKAGEV